MYYGIILTTIVVAFLIYTYATREPIDNILTYREYFSKWLKSHGQPDTPPEETPGPLAPYLKPIYKMSKKFANFGFTPNKMTIFNFLIAFYAILFIDLGEFWLMFAGLAILFSGMLDNVDGCIAGILNKESNTGAYLDAVVDRFGDIVWMIGPIFYILKLANFYGWFYTNLFVGLGFLAIVMTQIQEYCRARQQGLGLYRTVVTAGERSWRLIFIVVFIFELGASFLAQYLPLFQYGILRDIHVGAAIWSMPILIIIILVTAVISIIHLSVFGFRNLDKIEDQITPK